MTGAMAVIVVHARPRPSRRRGGAEQERFGGADARDLAGGGAERLPHRHFAPAAGRAQREQHADVGARDQQHEAGGRGHREQQRPNLLDVAAMRRLQFAPASPRAGTRARRRERAC